MANCVRASERFLSLLQPNTGAKSGQTLPFLAGHLRLSHAFEPAEKWCIKPLINAGVTWIYSHDFQESGAGVLNLNVKSSSETFWTIHPAIETGTEFDLSEDNSLRLYGKLGMIHFSGSTDPEIQARLQGLPASISPFPVSGDIDDNIADVEVGLTALSINEMKFKPGYQSQFSGNYESHAAFARFAVQS